MIRAFVTGLAMVVGCSTSGSTGDGGTNGDSGSNNDSGAGDSGITCGTATTLATGQKGLGGLAISGTTLIWTTCPTCIADLNGPGDIMTLQTSGGTPTVFAANQTTSASIVANATDVYWSDPNGNIMTLPVAGGPTPTAIYKAVNTPEFVAIDSTDIYWIAQGAIVKGPLGGGTKQKISNAPGSPRNVAVNGKGAFWLNQSSGNTATGSIESAGLAQDGGAPNTLVPSQTPLWVAVDANNVYWPDGPYGTGQTITPGAIMKVAAAGGTPTTLSTRPGLNIPGIVAVDATNIYWVETATGSTTNGYVMEMPLAGGTPKCIAPGPAIAWGLVVDANNVYWTGGGTDGTVAKAPK